jgi:3-oxoacyl-[acyl-carrier protein] reductase
VRKVALVTGSSSGLGASVARMLAQKGWNVAVHYATGRAGAEATAADCKALGVEVAILQGDVSLDADCRRIVEETVAKLGRLDALVNSAGTTKFVDHSDLEGLTSDDFAHILMVNVLGPYQMIRAAAPHLKATGAGSIVNVSSISGVVAGGSCHAYGASKAGVNTLTKSLARVLGPEIRINAVCPGFMNTPWMSSNLGEERKELYRKQWQDQTPLRMAAEPEDVAEIVVWFLEGAGLVTGQILVTDAGFTLGAPPNHSKMASEKRAADAAKQKEKAI